MDIEGELVRDGSDPGGAPAWSVNAADLTFHLDLSAASVAPDRLTQWVRRTVRITGRFVKRPDAAGKLRDICVVDAKGITLAERTEYLVGYQEGQSEAVSQLLQKSSGVRVLENYRPGKFLRVEVSDGEVGEKELQRMKQMTGVRFIERNSERSIKAE